MTSKEPCHFIVKRLRLQNKKRISKAAKEKMPTYKGKPIRITSDLSVEAQTPRKAWNDKLQLVKVNNCQPRLLCQQSSLLNQWRNKELPR
jgi:hypothetical protein